MSLQPRDLRKEYGAPFAIFSPDEGSIYRSLLSRDFNPPRSLDLGLIENPVARRSVEAHCRTLGLRKAVEMRHDAYEELMLEFYTTFRFTDEGGAAPQFSCRLTGRNVTVTCKTLRDIFGFPKGGHRAVPDDFDPAQFWKEISVGGGSKNGKAPSGLIRDTDLLHVHRYVSHVLAGRADSSKLAVRDLFYLSCLRRRVLVDTPFFLIKTFNSVVTNRRATMGLGNFITAIALHFGTFNPTGMKVLPTRPLLFKSKEVRNHGDEGEEDANNLAVVIFDQPIQKLEVAEKYETKLEKCLLRIKKLKEEAANLVNDMHHQELGSFDDDAEVRLTSNSSKGVSEKGLQYRGFKSIPSQIGNSNDLVARKTALANRKKVADTSSESDSPGTVVTHAPILSTDPSGDLGSNGSKRPLVLVCEETEDLRLKKVPKCPSKSSVPILGLDDNLVSKYHDSEPNLPAPLARFLCAKSSSLSSDLPTSLQTALDSLPRAWTVGLEGILKNPRQTTLMASLLSSRLAVLNQAILSQQESQADLQNRLAESDKALAASQLKCFLLRSEKSTKDIAAEGFLAEISGLKDKLVTSVAEKEGMEAKYTALETEKNESLRVKDKENDALRAELGRLRKEKLKMESDPMQSLQKIIVYTDYLCFFDSARTLLQSRQSADVILNEIREYTLKTPLYAGFLLPVLDLEVDYKVDLSWWPDRDQLISP